MSDRLDPRQLAEETVSQAMSQGAQAADAYVRQSHDLSLVWRNDAPETISRSSALGLGLRVSVDGRTLLVHSTDAGRDALRKLAAEAVAMARTLPAPAEATLFAEKADIAAMPHPDPELAAEPMSDKIARLALAEKGMLMIPGVTASGGTGYSESEGIQALANSRGLSLVSPFAQVQLSASAIAESGGESFSGDRYVEAPARRFLPDPAQVGRQAGQKAALMLGARPVPSARVPVIFTPDTSWVLLACLSEALRGDMVVQKRSYLGDLIGQRIASDLVTIVDDPLLPYGPASRAFDGEGTACRPQTLIENGILRAYLTDLASAKKLGVAPGGHAPRGGYSGAPGIGTSNFILKPGDSAREGIVVETQRGLYLTNLSGWWVGRSSVTDTFSSAAMGFWIEGGEVVHPVKGISIGGNLLEMLKAVDRVGRDLPRTESTCVPTIRVAEMAVSGI